MKSSTLTNLVNEEENGVLAVESGAPARRRQER